MNIKEVSDTMKMVHSNLLNFLDKEYDVEENYQKLQIMFDDHKFQSNKLLMNSLFHLITELSNNHNRSNNFFDKIERILQYFKTSIKENYSNSQIFNIFETNKRLLLFLYEEKLLIFDDYIVNKILTNKKYKKNKYIKYFYPELKEFIKNFVPKDLSNDDEDDNNYYGNDNDKNDNEKEEEEVNEDFYIKRKTGENQDYICTLIQKDAIEDFIIYVEKNSYPLNSEIKSSIYETNQFLICRRKELSLIEYASFYGSIQIINYLRLNNVEMNSTLWIYAVHSNNPQLFSLLEENKVSKYNVTYQEMFIESIKCHHIDFANYIFDNYLQNKVDNLFDYNTTIEALKYHNFTFIDSLYISQSSFYYLCKYDYSLYVELLFNLIYIDVNHIFKDFNDENIYYMSALHIAVEEENVDVVKLLLTRKEIDINMKDNDKTALYLAFEKNNKEILNILLDNNNININESSQIGNDEKTLLYRAVEKEDIELVKLLLSNKKLLINILCELGEDCEKTAFYLAVEKENIEIIKLFLSNEKLDINVLNKTKTTIKSRYYYYNNEKDENTDEEEKFKDFKLEADDEYDQNLGEYEDPYIINTKSAFYLAVEKENIEIIKLLLANGNLDINLLNIEEHIKSWSSERDIDEPDCYEYSSGGRYTTYEDVHEKITRYERTALDLAVDKENIEIINLLLANDELDINIINQMCVDKSRKEVYHSGDILNPESANVVTFKSTTLYNAVKKGNVEIVKILLSNTEIDVNKLASNTRFKKKKNKHEWSCDWKWEFESKEEETALHLAIQNDNKEIVKILTDAKGIDVKVEDSEP